MSGLKYRKCTQCGYILTAEQLVRCPRCNMNLLKKCSDCSGCPTSLWEKGKQSCDFVGHKTNENP